MFQTNVNNRFQHHVVFKSNEEIFLNDSLFNADILKIENGRYHLIHQSKSYSVEIVNVNVDDKTVILKVNGNEYTVVLKDKFDLLLQQMGMSNAASQKVNNLKAPMPGKVLSVVVKPGDAIKKGDPILILEAMKMENVLKATADVTIKEVKVQQGDAVEKNAVLVVMG